MSENNGGKDRDEEAAAALDADGEFIREHADILGVEYNPDMTMSDLLDAWMPRNSRFKKPQSGTGEREGINNAEDETDSDRHAGHRVRLRKATATGDDMSNTDSAVLLETMLSYLIPRVDVSSTAHEILEKFDGSLLRVIDSPIDELTKFKTVTEQAATVLNILRRLKNTGGRREYGFSNRGATSSFFGAAQFSDGDGSYVAYLDDDYHAVEIEQYSGVGAVDIETVVRSAYKYEAKNVIVARRETSLMPVWNGVDRYSKKLERMLSYIGARLIDVMIFSSVGFYSMQASLAGGDDSPSFLFTPLVTVTEFPEILERLAAARSENPD